MATTKKQTKAAAPKPRKPKHIGLVKNDSWLEPFEDAIRGRHEHALWKISQLTADGKRFEGSYRYGVRDGAFIERDANGQITARGRYEGGRRIVE